MATICTGQVWRVAVTANVLSAAGVKMNPSHIQTYTRNWFSIVQTVLQFVFHPTEKLLTQSDPHSGSRQKRNQKE